MRGKYSSVASSTFRLDGSLAAYSADTYTQSTEAVTSELLTQPGAVTRRLVRRLHRALGTSHVHAPLVADGPGVASAGHVYAGSLWVGCWSA